MSPHPASASSARILIADPLDPSARTIFSERGCAFVEHTGLDEAALCAKLTQLGSIEALVVRSATTVTAAVLDAAPALRVVGRAGVGVDNVDCEAATERGIVVMNAPEGNTTTTAELAIALLFSLARNIPQAAARTSRAQWSKKGLMGTELTGKTLGVIGLGRIGRVVAARAAGLSMTVLAHDPYLDASAPAPVPSVELVSLEDLLARSDFVTLHVPLVEATRKLLSAERIALMKPGARLINAARGGLIDEQALAEALERGHLAGAALDVLEHEPPSPEHPLVGREDVILTPHLGASSHEAQQNVARDIARQIADFLENGVPQNAVNAPAVDAATLRELAPYVLLAEKMGRFLAAECDNELAELELTLAGAIARRDASHVRLALLSGALAQLTNEGVNFVNAPRIAKERGLRVLEERAEDAGSWTSLIKVRARRRAGADGQPASATVWGTVFGRQPRFVRLEGVYVDLAPKGTILVTRHANEPGVVGRIGTVLGELGLNIRRIELGPPRANGTSTDSAQDSQPELATGFFTLDGEPDPRVVETIAQLASIHSVRLVRL